MSKNIPKIKAKKKKIETSAKKAKQKKTIIAVVTVAVIAVIAGFVINFINKQEIPETYSYQGQRVQLFSNGNFTAHLAHNVRKNGTYAKAAEDGTSSEASRGRTSVLFDVNGIIETGWIINNALHIPVEWDDGHGHGNVFPRER